MYSRSEVSSSTIRHPFSMPHFNSSSTPVRSVAFGANKKQTPHRTVVTVTGTDIIVEAGAGRESSPPQPHSHQNQQQHFIIGEFTYPGEVSPPSAVELNDRSAEFNRNITTTSTASRQRSSPIGAAITSDRNLTQVEQPQVHQQKRQVAAAASTSFMSIKKAPIIQPQAKSTDDANMHKLATVFKLSETLLKQYQEAFRIFDRNGDGCITSEELGTVMRSLGHKPSDGDVQDMINEVDADGSGTIEFDEFVQMMARRLSEREEEPEEEELQEAFEIFDRNKDGYITADELRQVMQSLGENLTDEELNEMMKAADVNGDGIINFNEFQEVWMEASHSK